MNIGLLVVTIFELMGLGRISWGVGMLPFLPVTMFGIGVLDCRRGEVFTAKRGLTLVDCLCGGP